MGIRADRGGSEDWVEQVRAASDIVEIVGQHVALKRVGRNWTGLCPFHPDKSPSFSVNTDRQFYHCFGCGAGGDVFKFIQEFEKVSFPEAVEALSRRANIPIPAQRSREAGVRAPLYEALEAAAAAYQQWLMDRVAGQAARDVLERRGVDIDAMREFRLGYAPAGWENLVERLRGRVPEGVLTGAGLATRREGGSGGLYDRFRDRLMVPLVEPGGRVVGFGARAMGEEPPKYLNSPETPVYHKGAFLYALDRARRAVGADDEVIVVEGYFDAIALHRAGVRNVVATSGTALTPEQAKLLRRRVGRVLVTYDGDDAGREAVQRSLGVLLGEGLEVRVADLPQGDDPDTLLRRGGAGAWQAVQGAAYDPVEFIHRHVLRTPGPGDPRERALQAVVRLAQQIADPVRARLLLERAEQVFGIAVAVLDRALRLKLGAGSESRPIEAAVQAQRAREQSVELTLLRALLHAPAAVDRVRERVSPADFRDEEARALAEALWAGDALGDSRLARELLAAPLRTETYDWQGEAEAFTRKLQKRKLEQQKREREMRLTATAGPDETHRLMHEIDEIARSLRNLN